MSTTKRGRTRVQRKDPPTRAPDGAMPWQKLINPDHDMHYVYVDPSHPFHGVQYYEDLGYSQVLKTEGGVRSAMDRTSSDGGSVVTSMHQVLMQIPKGDPRDPQEGTKAFLDAPGQRHCDAIEKRIIKPGGIDRLRGQHGAEGQSYLEFQNLSTPGHVEEVRHG